MEEFTVLNITISDITGLILAGGKGTRVDGLDKGWLKYKKIYLIEHQLKWFESQVSEVIISANRNISRYEKLGCQVVEDECSDQMGPLHGVKSGLAFCITDWLFVQPIDMPNLPVNFIQTQIEKLQGTHKAYYFASKQRDHYLSMLIHKSCVKDLAAFINAGNARVRDFLSKIQAKKVVTTLSESSFVNLNHPHDYIESE